MKNLNQNLKSLRNYNISIIGPTFSGNKGSATMLFAGIENLQKILSINKFYVFSYYPKIDKKINPYKNVEVYSMTPLNLAIKLFPLALFFKVLTTLKLPAHFLEKFKEIKVLKNTDIFIDMAGVSFIDGREKFLPFNILTIWSALLFGKPVVKYSQALGPFNHFLNKTAARVFLPRMKLIFSRGKITQSHLKSLHLNNVVLAADGGFCLQSKKQDLYFAQKIKAENKIFFNKKIAGISPSSVISEKCHKLGVNYEKILADFCKYLIDLGYNVLLIPYSVRINSNSTFNNDLPICLQVSEIINHPKNCFVIKEDLSPQKLNMIIKLTNFFIASRFHSMVASLSVGVPVIVCGWSHKYQEVLDMFGLKDYTFSYKSFSVHKLQKYFDKISFNEKIIKEQIQKNLPKVQKSSLNQIILIKNLLEA